MRIRDTRDELDRAGKQKLLETFAFKSVYPQLIHIHTEEFSAVCPGTGLPDVATIDFFYVPQEKCIELKALKFYLFSFRQDEIFQEPVTDVLFEDLWASMEPHYLYLRVKYNIRGGFDTTTYVEKGDRKGLTLPASVYRSEPW